MAAKEGHHEAIWDDLPAGVDEATRQKFQQLFACFDSDEDVSASQLKSVFAALGQGIPTDEAIEAMRTVVESEKRLPFSERRLAEDHQQSRAIGEHGERRQALAYPTWAKPEFPHIFDALVQTAKRSPDSRGFGSADASGTQYVWKTWSEVFSDATNFGYALRHLFNVQKGDRVGICLSTCYAWQVANFGTVALGASVVTMYDSFGAEALAYIATKMQLSTVVAGRNQFKFLSSLPQTVKDIVLVGDYEDSELTSLNDQFKLHRLADVLAVGANNPSAFPTDIAIESPALYCFTSGTTGPPKGAVHTHFSILSSVRTAADVIPLHPDDRHLAALPLAHIMEYWLELYFVAKGVEVAFFRGDPRLLLSDMQTAKPTVVITVPRLMSRIHDTVVTTLLAKEGVPGLLSRLAVISKLRNWRERALVRSYWDWIVFDRVRDALGGRVRLFATGSAPIAADVLEFLRVAFSAIILEGYGMTEGCVTNVTSPLEHVPYSVGPVLGNVEMELRSLPDMNYYITDKPHPRGEICIRGHSVAVGYHEEPELTAAAFTEDGFYRTGDVGMWTAQGTLRIIDRVKDLFKLAQAEYVSPAKLENIYGLSPYVAQIWVHGDSTQASIVAVVVPDPDGIKTLDTDLHTALKNDFARLAHEHKLPGYERIACFHIHDSAFSVENDLLTPTLKLKRFALRKAFADHISNMYSSL